MRIRLPNPWKRRDDRFYRWPSAWRREGGEHALADSASTARRLTSGVKTYTMRSTSDPLGAPCFYSCSGSPGKEYAVGAISSVNRSATPPPACAYAHNWIGDAIRYCADMLGLPSISHPESRSTGWTWSWRRLRRFEAEDKKQGQNFVPGQRVLAGSDLKASDATNGGRYVVAQRTRESTDRLGYKTQPMKRRKSGKRLLAFTVR